MSRIPHLLAAGALAAAAPLGAGGCLIYDATINQRPSLEIVNRSDELIYRGDRVALYAQVSDPDRHVVSTRWRAYACTDVPVTCDREPFETSTIDEIAFTVPSTRADEAVPVRALRVVLEGEDELGAIARPSQELVLPVANHAPAIELDKRSRYGFLVGTPIDVFAKVTDADDATTTLVQPLGWEVFPPAQLAHTIEDIPVPDVDPTALQVGKRLVPAGAGDWDVRVTAIDPQGATTSETITLVVAEDGPPCLAQLAPLVPADGAALPLTEPTLFRVPVVVDELDVYPPVAGDPTYGTTRFAWSLRGPGDATHAPLPGATGNSVALDPATYTPGDVLELRVEIFDRNDTAIPCPDGDATCSVIAAPACLQRQTWRVEVR